MRASRASVASQVKQPKIEHIARIKAAVFVVCLFPLALLVWRATTGGLSANPIEDVTHHTGWWTLTFLMIVLAVTPVRQLFGLPWLLRLRRMLGLFAFFYACLHFLTYLVLDQFFHFGDIVDDVVKRPYITVGFTAFLLLIPLAATSTNTMVRRLGAARWQALHRFVYLIAILGVLHFLWLVKKDLREPLAFAAILAGLLGVRLLYVLRRRAAAA
jgi:methionine sulfoxide reductase heme-binding subunit